jgi:hypothetical protein
LLIARGDWALDCRLGVPGASDHTFVEATESQSLPDWIGRHVRMYAWLGGVPIDAHGSEHMVISEDVARRRAY